MKKTIIIIIIFVALLTMGSAYASWSDSVSAGVNAESAFVIVRYTGRSLISGSVSYDMTQGTIGPSNPYVSVEETSTHTSAGTNTVEYTITNNGSVPIVFEGVSLKYGQVSKSGGNASYQQCVDAMDVTYSYTNGSYSGSVDITDIESTSEYRFSDYQNNVIAKNGGTCTMTVTYERNYISFWVDIWDALWGNSTTITLVREDNLLYSID